MNDDGGLNPGNAGAIYLLGIDTCGPSGSVALGRLNGPGEMEILNQTELEGRSYSSTLVNAVAGLLAIRGIQLRDVGCLVAVNGPGSFTGVRVGLSAVKGLAEPGRIPVISISRLEVLSDKAAVSSAALDAHRKEVFLRTTGPENNLRELLAGASDLAAIPPPREVAVCDEPAAELLGAVWPDALLVQVSPPTATDALLLAAPLVRSAQFVDLALLDGHYLRRSDAEIFGPPPARRL